MTPEVHVFTTPAGVVTFIPTATGIPIQTQFKQKENMKIAAAHPTEDLIHFVADHPDVIRADPHEFGEMYTRAKNLDNLTPKMILALLQVRDLEFTPDGKQVIGPTGGHLQRPPKVFDLIEHESTNLIRNDDELTPLYLVAGKPRLAGSWVNLPTYRILVIYSNES